MHFFLITFLTVLFTVSFLNFLLLLLLLYSSCRYHPLTLFASHSLSSPGVAANGAHVFVVSSSLSCVLVCLCLHSQQHTASRSGWPGKLQQYCTLQFCKLGALLSMCLLLDGKISQWPHLASASSFTWFAPFARRVYSPSVLHLYPLLIDWIWLGCLLPFPSFLPSFVRWRHCSLASLRWSIIWLGRSSSQVLMQAPKWKHLPLSPGWCFLPINSHLLLSLGKQCTVTLLDNWVANQRISHSLYLQLLLIATNLTVPVNLHLYSLFLS